MTELKNLLEDDVRILFISNHPIYPIRLLRIIEKLYPKLYFRILAINTFVPHIKNFQKQVLRHYKTIEDPSPKIDFRMLPAPTSRYIWFKEQFYTYRLGILNGVILNGVRCCILTFSLFSESLKSWRVPAPCVRSSVSHLR